ncbi:hypothetical protein BDC45DRAFT_521545 [Circinella umbellata]|nr:hypothetical protein BDC45DRAFT_521545 [Circinella umbellata]
MSQNKSTSTINNSAGNKDLSCLRCRKKKAKCSKTRPACTRCARSNQPFFSFSNSFGFSYMYKYLYI